MDAEGNGQQCDTEAAQTIQSKEHRIALLQQFYVLVGEGRKGRQTAAKASNKK